MVLGRNRKTVQVSNVSFASEMTFFYLGSLQELQELQDSKELLFESENDFFLVRNFNVFRVSKPGEPRILKAVSLELNPDSVSVKVQLTKDTLFGFARKEQLFLIETQDGFYLPGPVMMFSKKEKEHGP